MTDYFDDYAQKLKLADLLRRDVIGRALKDLGINPGDHVLDAGCGAGSQLPLLAELAGPEGRVTGLDISREFVGLSEQRVAGSGLEERVRVINGDNNKMPFGEGSFDCVVSIDCACYPFASNPIGQLKEMKRVTRRSGTVAIMGWSSQELLPGYPGLESKLNTTSSLVSLTKTTIDPKTHFMRLAGWFVEAGFENAWGKTYAGDIQGPLADIQKEAVLAFFEMLWPDFQCCLSGEELELFERINNPASSDFILDRDDYYGFFTYTGFCGSVPED